MREAVQSTQLPTNSTTTNTSPKTRRLRGSPKILRESALLPHSKSDSALDVLNKNANENRMDIDFVAADDNWVEQLLDQNDSNDPPFTFTVTLNGRAPNITPPPPEEEEQVEQFNVTLPASPRGRKRKFSSPANIFDDEMLSVEVENDSENQTQDTEERRTVPKKKIRCLHWPFCKRALHCAYVHPLLPCKNFPKCKFGQKCLFIHPSVPCKFGVNCTRGTNCPFDHPNLPGTILPPPQPSLVHNFKHPFGHPHLSPTFSKFHQFQPSLPFYPKKMYHNKSLTLNNTPQHNAIPTIAPQATTICRYGIACLRENCTFIHPKELCKFGVRCSLGQSCPFRHTTTIWRQILNT